MKHMGTKSEKMSARPKHKTLQSLLRGEKI